MLITLEVDNEETPWHSHVEGQVFVIWRGVMELATESGRWVMPPGRMGWIPPLSHHSAVAHGEVRGLLFYMDQAWAPRLSETPGVFPISPLAEALFQRMAEIGEGERYEHLLVVLLDELAAAVVEPLHIPMPQDERLVRIARALTANPGDPRLLDDWAKVAGMSRRSMMRHMRTQTGLSFGVWRQCIRLMAALPLLAAGHSVTSVALDLGFESVSTFIANFRARFGVTPSRYFRSYPGHPLK